MPLAIVKLDTIISITTLCASPSYSKNLDADLSAGVSRRQLNFAVLTTVMNPVGLIIFGWLELFVSSQYRKQRMRTTVSASIP